MQYRLPIVLLLMGMAGLTMTAPVGAQEGSERLSYTNLRKFTIPYTFDNSRGQLKEARLFYSLTDGPWKRSSVAVAGQRGFEVDTDQDGTYSFGVQIEYENGTVEPTQLDQLRSRIRIVVDSQAPQIKIQPLTGNPGTAGVEWTVEDPNLDPNSIRLECRWPNQANWMPIPGRYEASGPRASYFWELKADQRLEVRVLASDQAKNNGQSGVVSTPPGSGGSDYPKYDNPAQPGNSNAKVKQYFINSKRITLETKVLVGKSGIAQVDVYMTRDMNGKWEKLPNVQTLPGTKANPVAQSGDGVSHEEYRKITFEVEKEGRYGFIVGGKNGVGLGPGVPIDGATPRVLVEVDTTPPMTKILEAKVVPSGLRGNVLNVTWQVSDPNLADGPIIIEINPDANQPDKWQVVGQNLDNTGRYVWPVPENTPASFFVRIRAIDRATNTGQAVTTKAVIADHQAPEFEIEGVEPAPSER